MVDGIDLIACYPHRSEHLLEAAISDINDVAEIKRAASVSDINAFYGKRCSHHKESLLIFRTFHNEFMRREGGLEHSDACDRLYKRLTDQETNILELTEKDIH